MLIPKAHDLEAAMALTYGTVPVREYQQCLVSKLRSHRFVLVLVIAGHCAANQMAPVLSVPIATREVYVHSDGCSRA